MFLNFDIWMCNSLLQYLGRLLDIFRQCRLAHACSPESGDRFKRFPVHSPGLVPVEAKMMLSSRTVRLARLRASLAFAAGVFGHLENP